MEAQGAATRRKLLDVSRRLMMAQGYSATSIDVICREANVTKGAFFHYFKTKQALGEQVLRDYWETRQRQFQDALPANDGTPLGQLRAFLDAVASVFMNDPDGMTCLAGSFTQELASNSSHFRVLTAGLFAEWAQQVRPLLNAAKSASPAAADADIDLLAEHIIVVIEGALILALARNNRDVIARHVNLLDQQLKHIFQQ
jgi:TetR/AcrR family transcriptional repressor of nem operon